jgi:hypothetical protein
LHGLCSFFVPSSRDIDSLAVDGFERRRLKPVMRILGSVTPTGAGVAGQVAEVGANAANAHCQLGAVCRSAGAGLSAGRNEFAGAATTT